MRAQEVLDALTVYDRKKSLKKSILGDPKEIVDLKKIIKKYQQNLNENLNLEDIISIKKSFKQLKQKKVRPTSCLSC